MLRIDPTRTDHWLMVTRSFDADVPHEEHDLQVEVSSMRKDHNRSPEQWDEVFSFHEEGNIVCQRFLIQLKLPPP